MVDVDRSVIARYKKAGNVFEILVDCDKALELKKGENVAVEDVVATSDVFKDVKKGEKASENDLKEVFQTEDKNEIFRRIIKDGEVQLTSKHREEEREKKFKMIVNLIHRNAVDSKTGYPHPVASIENALNESNFRVDDHKKAEEQVEDALKAIRALIPIKFEKKEIAVKVPAAYAGLAKGIVSKHKVIKEEWLNDGSYCSVVEIPSGIMDEFFDSLNKVSR